jgi:hypothetical protein
VSDDDNIDKIPLEEWKAAAIKRMRERMAKDPEGTAAIVDEMFASGRVQGELDRKTDAEVADLLSKLEDTLGLTVFSPIVVLLNSACERLWRAGGGKTYDRRMGELEDALRRIQHIARNPDRTRSSGEDFREVNMIATAALDSK